MLDRRDTARDKGIVGSVPDTTGHGTTLHSFVSNFSEPAVAKPRSLSLARKGRTFLTRIISWRDNFVGVAFSSEQPYQLPFSDIEQRLRKSEEKKRQLQRRINQLLGEG